MKHCFTLCIILFQLPVSRAFAQQGILDPGFGTGGYVQIFSNSPGWVGPINDITIQPDNKIITVGPTFTSPNQGFSITRNLANGFPDNTFSGDGFQIIQPTGPANTETHATAYAVAVLPDGRIVVAGDRYDRMEPFPPGSPGIETYFTMIAWLNPDGSVAHIGTFDFSPGNFYEGAFGIDVQSDGKVVVTGEAYNAATGVSSMTIMRFNGNGTLDNSFDNDGIVYVNFPGLSRGYDVEIQSDGKIIVAGNVQNAANSFDFAVVRLTSTGSYDNSFDGDGRAVIAVGTNLRTAAELEVLPSGKYLLAAAISSSASLVVRLTSNGTIDNSFDGDGRLVLTYFINAMIVQADGKILLGGEEILRLLPTGSLDPSFGNGGLAILTGLPSSNPMFRDIALQSDGKIIAGDSQGPRLLARFTNIVAPVINCSGSNAIVGTIPDVYAVPQGGSANTIYTGYGPQTLMLTVQATQGLAPFSYSWSTGSLLSSATVSPSTPGIHNYTVTITDHNGCSTVVSKQISVIDVRCGNKMDKVVLCHGNKINCVSPNAVAAQLNIGRTLGECTPLLTRGTNTEAIPLQPEFSLIASPNPASDYFLVAAQTQNVGEKITLTVYDVTGKQVLVKNLAAQTSVKIGKELKAGVYFIRAQQGKNTSSQKLIKTY